MAKRGDQPEADPINGQHNARARTEKIDSSMERMYQLRRQIQAKIDEHVTPLREEVGEIKKLLRDDQELSTEMINARFGSYALERKARDNGDQRTLDAIRELFDITPIGGQPDLVEAIEQDNAAA